MTRAALYIFGALAIVLALADALATWRVHP